MFNSRDTWYLQPVEDEEDDSYIEDIYDTNPDLFTLKIHYNGTFEQTPLREYKGGKLRIIDFVNMDYFNLLDMDVIALGAGYRYDKLVLYLWRIPETTLDNGLRPLQCTDDCVDLIEKARQWRFIDVYLDGPNPLIRFWQAARAYNVIRFKRAMERMKEESPEAVEWLIDHAGDPKRWSKVYFPLTLKSDMLCNNLSESFNSFILKARNKPIITMLETIRRLIMEKIRDNRQSMERRHGTVCPRIMKELEERFLFSQNMVSNWNGGDSFEVESMGRIYVVDVNAKMCTCRIWQLTGILCAHAIPCITTMRMQSVELVDPCYYKSLFIQTYSNVLKPTTSPAFWDHAPGFTLAPPKCVRQVGRPKKLRRRGPLEGMNDGNKYRASRSSIRKCSLCASTEHTKAKCPQRPSEPQPPAKGKGKKRKGSTDVGPSRKTRRQSTRNKKKEDLSKLEEVMKRTQEELNVREMDE